jgi:hypothetical protein
VRQTLTTISVRLLTSESTSAALAATLERASDGLFKLSGVYMNIPELGLRGSRSEIHHGAFLLDFHPGAQPVLDGEYWTDRGTRGTLELKARSRNLATSFREAQSVVGSGREGRRRR